MVLYRGVGRGTGDDAKAAGESAVRTAMLMLEGHVPEAAILFASSIYNQEVLLASIVAGLPNIPIVGGSTAGEMIQDGVSKDQSVVLLLLATDRGAQFASAKSMLTPHAERESGALLAQSIQSLISSQKLATTLMFPDGLTGNAAEILRGVSGQMGNTLSVVGAASGDNFNFKKTYQYFGKEVLSGAVVGLGVSRGVKVGIGAEHGWRTVGLPMKATKVEGALLVELEGKPAIGMYEKYFGELSRELHEEAMSKLAINYPLGIRVEGSDDVLIRTPLSVDERGAMLMGADIPEGAAVRLMIGSVDSMITSAGKAATTARQGLGGSAPRAAIVLSSLTRKKLLGDRSGAEITAVRDVLGHDIPLIGMYGYGEFSPLHTLSRERSTAVSAFQNQSIVVIALSGT